MRISQTYEPSGELAASFATTPVRRHLFGLSGPYGLGNAPFEEAG